MKKAVAILAIIVVGMVAAYIFLAGRAGSSTALRAGLKFVRYTNSPAGPLALFRITNNPGSVSFRFASIQEWTPSGWVTVSNNVPVSLGLGGPTLVLPRTEARLRCIFDFSDQSHGLLDEFLDLFRSFDGRRTFLSRWREGFVTNDLPAIATP